MDTLGQLSAVTKDCPLSNYSAGEVVEQDILSNEQAANFQAPVLPKAQHSAVVYKNARSRPNEQHKSWMHL